MRYVYILAIALASTGCDEALKSMAASEVRVIHGRGASAGPIRSADVTAYSLWPDGTRRAVISQTMTGATGLFSLNISQHSGPVEVAVSHGYYLEAATQALVTLSNVELRARVPQVINFGAEISITPLSDFAASRADQLVLEGRTMQEAIVEANGKASIAAGLNNIYITVSDPSVTLQNPSSQASRYAALLAGISQEATDTGSNTLIFSQILTNDFTDGKFDGGQWTAVAAAINKFINSGANSAGFTSASETVLISQP